MELKSQITTLHYYLDDRNEDEKMANIYDFNLSSPRILIKKENLKYYFSMADGKVEQMIELKDELPLQIGGKYIMQAVLDTGIATFILII